MKHSQPNILYVFTDQQTAGAMSCAGNTDLHTPAMDSLASAGTRFERAYCTYPLCTPARASMFTGQMPHTVGIGGNGEDIGEAFRARELGVVLSDVGYECVYGGKWHVPEIALPEGHGFRQICGFDDVGLPEACAEFLAAPHERPFLLVAAFDNPHNICEWSRDQPLPWGNVPPAHLADCPALPANCALAPCEPEAVRRERSRVGIYRDAAYTPEDWRRYRHAYFRLVEKVDAQIGAILEALRAAGLDEETVVIFSSDHGEANGAHLWNQKTVLYEESVRVPLILREPGGKGARVDARLVSNGLDLFPTICDYAGVEVPEGLPGRSLRPLVAGELVADWRDHLVIETALDCDGTTGLAVCSARHKYVLYSFGKYREQLYDLGKDPGEMVNLAGCSSHAALVEECRDLLARWIEETGYREGAHYSHPRQRPRVPGEEYDHEPR